MILTLQANDMATFPNYLSNLSEGEAFLRSKTVTAIEGSDDLGLHAGMVERSMDLIHHFVRSHDTANQDILAVQHLGIRMFNGMASAMALLMRGYYQPAALQMRDLLETVFLLDLFTRDRSLIAVWRTSDERARWKRFKPVAVRIELDTLDGFTELRRAAAYDLLSSLAGHPNVMGFQMLRPAGGDAHCGPFFEARAMDAVLAELAKIAVQAGGTFTHFFGAATKGDYAVKIGLLETQSAWMQRFFGRSIDRQTLEEMKALMAQLP
jgi:hypothetical protein